MYQPYISIDILEVAARRVASRLPLQIRYSLNGRLERGLYLAAQGAVSPLFDPSQPCRTRLFQVRSSNQYVPPFSYMVDLDALTCECPDYQKGHHCKHILAAQITEQAKFELA